MSSIRFANCGQNYPVQSARYLCRFLYINAKEPCARKAQLPITTPSLPTTRQGNSLVTEPLLGSALFCLFRSTQPKHIDPFSPNDQSTYSDIGASAFEGNSWFGTWSRYVPNVVLGTSERGCDRFRTWLAGWGMRFMGESDDGLRVDRGGDPRPLWRLRANGLPNFFILLSTFAQRFGRR